MIENFQAKFDTLSQNMTSQISQDDDESNAYQRPTKSPRAELNLAPQIDELTKAVQFLKENKVEKDTFDLEIFNLKKMLGEEEEEIEAINDKLNNNGTKKTLKRGATMTNLILESLAEQIEKWDRTSEIVSELEPGTRECLK